MSITLDTAISGLKAAQRSLDAISNNISNASTPGYTRKILPQETLVIAGDGVGVKVGALIRKVDETLVKDIFRQISRSESYGIRQKYLTRVQDFHGASEAQRSIGAQLTRLNNAFNRLSTAPDDANLLNEVVFAARQTTIKINDFATTLNNIRRDVESAISAAVTEANQAIANIAQYNLEITRQRGAQQSTALLEDFRDEAINTLSKYIEVSTYASGDGKVFVSTKQGAVLADDVAHPLFFTPTNVLPTSYYPGGGLNGLTLESISGTDITQTGLGGAIGALFEMRDTTVPTYTAQLDEFAQKLAYRFETQGLRLFTGADGTVPANVAPPGLVGYVGFSSFIRVNALVEADPTLLRNGTNGGTENDGSNEVIRRAAQYAFGAFEYQQALGTVNIGALPPLVGALGITTNNSVVGTVNLEAFAQLGDIPGITLPGSFNLTFSGMGSQVINVLVTDTAASLANKINVAFGATKAIVNGNGALQLNHQGDITTSNNTIGAPNFALLGFNFGVTAQPNPTFQIQVGTRTPVTISITPADTAVQLLASLNAVPGVTASLTGGGMLQIRPTEGGDLKLIDGNGLPLAAMGVSISDVAHTSFRQTNLGPAADLTTGLLGNSTIGDYMRLIITSHAETMRLNDDQLENEVSFQQVLETRFRNESGVNIDEEMSEMIRIQTTYTAAAKIISTTQRLFDDLLNAFS